MQRIVSFVLGQAVLPAYKEIKKIKMMQQFFDWLKWKNNIKRLDGIGGAASLTLPVWKMHLPDARVSGRPLPSTYARGCQWNIRWNTVRPRNSINSSETGCDVVLS